MNSIDITLPRLIVAHDYHEFNMYDEMLKRVDRRLRCAEVGFDHNEGMYQGVVYSGRKPSAKEIEALRIKPLRSRR